MAIRWKGIPAQAAKEILVTVNVDDCEHIAMEYVRRNPTQTIDVLGLEHLSMLLVKNIGDLTEDELTYLDTCIRAEQNKRKW